MFHSLTQRDLNQLRNKNTISDYRTLLKMNTYPSSKIQQDIVALDKQTQLIDKTISTEEKRIEL